ncbi:T9SS type A sorting domain-containing protein [bacterium]|nr:T9SS type A sorting domain-containing protein [bacterium]
MKRFLRPLSFVFLIVLLRLFNLSELHAQHLEYKWVRHTGDQLESPSMKRIVASNEGYAFMLDSDDHHINLIDASGDILWEKHYPVSVQELAADDAGNCLILGYLDADLTLDLVGGDQVTLINTHTGSLFLGMINNLGRWLWAFMPEISIGPPKYMKSLHLAMSPLAGEFAFAVNNSENGLDNGVALPDGAYIWSYSADGTRKWMQKMLGQDHCVTDMVYDDYGRCIAGIRFKGVMTYEDMNATIEWESEGGCNGALVAIDQNGVLKWSSQFGQGGNIMHLRCDIDGTGNIVVCGNFKDSVIFGKSEVNETVLAFQSDIDFRDYMFWGQYDEHGELSYVNSESWYTYYRNPDIHGMADGGFVVSATYDPYMQMAAKTAIPHNATSIMRFDTDGDLLASVGGSAPSLCGRGLSDFDCDDQGRCYYVGGVTARPFDTVYFGPYEFSIRCDEEAAALDPSMFYVSWSEAFIACMQTGPLYEDSRFICGGIRSYDKINTSGIQIDFSNGGGSTVTDEHGYFRQMLPKNWYGNVTVENGQAEISPEMHTFSALQYDYYRCNFFWFGPDTVILSGVIFFNPSHVPMEGVHLETDDGLFEATTDEDGYYRLKLPRDWAGTVMLECQGWDFKDHYSTYDRVFEDMVQQDYWLAQDAVIKMSGVIFYHPSFYWIEGVEIVFSDGGGSAFTNEAGFYEKELPYGWSGTVYAQINGLPIGPSERQYDRTLTYIYSQDYYVLLPPTSEMHGAMKRAGGWSTGEHLSIEFGGTMGSVNIDSTELFTLRLPTHWQGSLIPKAEGYRFYPDSMTFSAYTSPDTLLNFLIYPEDASQGLICGAGSDSLGFNGFFEASLYPIVSDTLPADLNEIDVVMLGASTVTGEETAAELSAFVAGGGGVVLTENIPAILAGGDDLSSIAGWFGAAQMGRVYSCEAQVSVPYPLLSQLDEDSLLACPDSAWAVSGLDDSAISVSTWTGEDDLWHSFVRVHQQGKLAYWSTVNPDTGASLSLFTAILQWLVDENTAVAQEEESSIIPDSFNLLPAYPNPFNPTTNLTYHLSEDSHVKLEIYDVNGRCVKVLEDRMKSAGTHLHTWRATDADGIRVASGIYLCRLCAGSVVKTQKIILMK